MLPYLFPPYISDNPILLIGRINIIPPHNISYYTRLKKICQGVFTPNLKYIPISLLFSLFLSVFLSFLKFISFFEPIFESRENKRKPEISRAFTEFYFCCFFTKKHPAVGLKPLRGEFFFILPLLFPFCSQGRVSQSLRYQAPVQGCRNTKSLLSRRCCP